MKIICTKCSSEDVYMVQPEIEKMPETQTIDEMVGNMNQVVPLVYKLTTWACKNCGYSVSR